MSQRGSKAVARAVIAAAVLALLVAAAVPARAQEPEPDETTATTTPAPPPAPTGSPVAPRIDLVSQTPFVAPTDVFRIGLDIDGAPEGAELSFTMHLSVETGRDNQDNRTPQARYDDFVAGKPDTTSDRWASPLSFPLANLPGDGSGTIEAAFEIVPDGEPPLVGFRFSEPGVYPLTIELRAPEGGSVLASITTYLVRLPAQSETAPPLTVAPMVDVRAPVSLDPDGSREIEPDALDRIHDLIESLVDQPSGPLTLGATPETLEALMATGPVPATANAPATTGADLVGALHQSLAGRLVLGSTYVDLDVSAWTASDMGAPLEYQRSHGVNVAAAVLDGSAAIDQRTWRADPSLSAAGLAELHSLGIDQVVMDEGVLGPLDPRSSPDSTSTQVAHTQPFDIEDADGRRIRAVAADGSLGERLTHTDDEQLNAQILIADLAVTYFGAASPQVNDVAEARRGITFAVPTDELASRSLVPFLAAFLTPPPPSGGGAAIFRPGTLSDLFSLPPATADGGTEAAVRTFTPDTTSDAPTDMGDYPDRLDAAEDAVSAYESMVIDTEPQRIVPLRQLLDVSGAAELDPHERDEYLDAAAGSADAALAGVRIPEQDSITLTATEYEIPIFLENDLPYPVAVRVELESTKLTFPDGQELQVALEPGSNRVPVRVETVSGGTFPLDLTVTTPDQRVTIGEAVIEMRSTAVSGLGLALTISAGFFLMVWWARNWRKTRRTALDGPVDPDGDRGTAGDSPEVPRTPSGTFTVGPLTDLDDADLDDAETVASTTGGVPPDPHQ